MPAPITIKTKILITGIVTCFAFGILFWEHFHGGVLSHHLLQQKELPAISNWWNGIFLPILTWILLGRIEKRLIYQSSSTQPLGNLSARIMGRFIVGLSLGVCLAVSFTNEYTTFLENVIYVFLLLGLIVPIYYAEFILGFILSMTYTFGAILPTLFILILATLGFLMYRFIRPLIIKLSVIISNTLLKSPNR